MIRTLALLAVGSATALVVPSAPRCSGHPMQTRTGRVACIATSDVDKELLAASQKVTMIAKRFGKEQGAAAQKWVEQAVKSGDARTDSLIQMQQGLFDECKLDDGGKCLELSDAIEALTAAVDTRKKEPTDGCERAPCVEPIPLPSTLRHLTSVSSLAVSPVTVKIISGNTPIQAAATKLRSTAARFGGKQKEAADAWIKKVTSGAEASAAGLLEEQIVLFGECVLSEDGSPSDCQQLEEALAELQKAIDVCNVDSKADCDPEEVAAEIKAAGKAASKVAKDTNTKAAPKRESGRKRRAVKNFFGKLFGSGGKAMSPYAVASFLAAPGEVDAALEGKSIDELATGLQKAGVPASTISLARASVLPYMPGMTPPGIDSADAPWNLSPYAVASFLAEPGLADSALWGKSIEELAAILESEGVPSSTIANARVNVLPYLKGQTTPGTDSTERPK